MWLCRYPSLKLLAVGCLRADEQGPAVLALVVLALERLQLVIGAERVLVRRHPRTAEVCFLDSPTRRPGPHGLPTCFYATGAEGLQGRAATSEQIRRCINNQSQKHQHTLPGRGAFGGAPARGG